MAVAYESVATTSWQTVTNGNNLTITKPTGLAVGDYMVAHLTNVVGGSNNADGWDTPSGWTIINNDSESGNSNSSCSLVVFYKVADSGDAAASNFSFTKNGSQGTTVHGALYRISGASAIAKASDSQTSDLTPTYTNTITPSFADSLLLFLASYADAGAASGSASGYAITTSNPTWTEVYDSYGQIFPHRGLAAGAYASRPEATATGDSSLTFVATGGNAQNSIGVIVVLSPIVNVTASPAVIDVTASVIAPSVSGGASVSPSVIDITTSVVAPTVSFPTDDWTNQSKNSSSWTNQNKS